MARRKASTIPETITPSLQSRKRQLSTANTPITTTITPGGRRSKRIRASSKNNPSGNGEIVTAKKSKYFEGSDSEDGEDGQRGTSSITQQEETSGYEGDNTSASLASSSVFSRAPSSNEEVYEPEATPRGDMVRFPMKYNLRLARLSRKVKSFGDRV